jgi:hypothetical protein
MSYIVSIAILLSVLVPSVFARPADWQIRDGRLYVKGQWTFLKIAKPLRNFADAEQVEQLIKDLPLLKQKNYNCIEINCYWHHFDHRGDGAIDVSTEPLKKLVDAIYARGMFPCLSVETYGVGGGQLPHAFYEKHPDAIAIDHLGKKVSDDEYGFGSTVPTLFSPDYLKASRTFIENITKSIDHSKILHFETTVEPQFMGNHALDFTEHAQRAYEHWVAKTKVDAPAFPSQFPVSEEFLNNPIWNRFRAEYLANWINEDAAVFRRIAGNGAYIAVDYLETCGKDMRNRNGDSMTFLTALTAPNIVQVNWHWHVNKRTSNQCAYDNVKKVMKLAGKDWAVSEHMTINGSDYRVDDMEKLLRNTIAQGSLYAWEFTNVANDPDTFSLYNENWTPKALIKVVDDNWQDWMKEINQESSRRAAH